MEAVRETIMTARSPETGRWAICIVFALGMHAAGAAALLAPWKVAPVQVANAPLIVVELLPLPVAPDTKETERPPGPQQPAVELQPPQPLEKPVERPPVVQKAEALPLPAAQEPVEQVAALPQTEPQLAVMPPPKPPEKTVEKPVDTPVDKTAEKEVKKRHRQVQASLASAPSRAELHAERAAAQMPGSSSDIHVLVKNWNSELVARLERYKRYPSEALSRGEQGAVQLAFSVDRSGGVHHAHITRSSGSRLLDKATLDLVERAAPMPPPPPEMVGAQIGIVVPVRYSIRGDRRP
ncbi:MAG: TonB family protein [Pseudolabrys sp.]